MRLFPCQAVPIIAAGCLVAASVAPAGDLPTRAKTVANSPADRVAEVRVHDAAFALLIESFQQLQTSMIESDYQERVFAADQLVDGKVRRQTLAWAKQERDLRLARLAHQLRQMETGYHFARRDHEREAGVGVPHDATQEAAAERLKELAVFQPASTPKRELAVSTVVPSQTIATRYLTEK